MYSRYFVYIYIYIDILEWWIYWLLIAGGGMIRWSFSSVERCEDVHRSAVHPSLWLAAGSRVLWWWPSRASAGCGADVSWTATCQESHWRNNSPPLAHGFQFSMNSVMVHDLESHWATGPLRSNHCSLMNRLMATLGAIFEVLGTNHGRNEMRGSEASTIG